MKGGPFDRLDTEARSLLASRGWNIRQTLFDGVWVAERTGYPPIVSASWVDLLRQCLQLDAVATDPTTETDR